MTTPSTARKAGPLLGNGSTTAFPFTFKVFAAADVAVTIANSSGVETPLVLNTDYSVTLNGNQDTSPGGTVNYPISGAALPSGSKLSIVGDLDYDQPLDLPSGGNFSPTALENQLDRATMQIQQLAEGLSRAAKLPVTNSEDPATLVADIVRLADSADNIDTLVANLADITTVADDLNEPVSEINTVAGAITNVNNVGNNISNVNTVAGISANVTTVAAIDDDVTAVAGVAANVTTVAGVSAAVTAVAAIDDDVTIAAANVADITNFADVYQGPKTSDPTLRNNGNALQVGDLYFNTVEQALRTYGGTQWVSGTAGTVGVQQFSGNASATAFTLATAPAGENNTQVYIGGVYQQKDQYSVSGTTLTFSTAPPSGTNNVEVVTISTLAIGQTDAALVSFLPAGVGAVTRTAQNKLRDTVSVKDFGATGDGSTNDTAAINTALIAVNALGKVALYFPAGIYRYSGGGWLGNGVVITGAGRDATTIRSIAATPTDGYLFDCRGYGSGIQSMRFDAVGTTQTGGSYVWLKAPESFIDDFHMTNDFNGILMTGNVSRIRHGRFQDGATGATRIRAEGGDNSQLIDDVLMGAQSPQVSFAGIRVRNSSALIISNTSVIQQGHALLVDPTTSTQSSNTADGSVFSLYANNCFFDNSSGNGIRITAIGTGSVVRCRFANCWVGSSTSDGVFIVNSGSGIVQGMYFDSCHAVLNGTGGSGAGFTTGGTVTDVSINGGLIANNTEGVYFNSGTTNSKVSNATIGAGGGLSGNSGNGVVLASGTSNIVVTGNTVINNTSNGVAALGTAAGYVIADNYISGNGTNLTVTATLNRVVRNNVGVTSPDFAAGNSLVASGGTSVVVTHGLGVAPSAASIQISPTTGWGSNPLYVDTTTITSTQFTVRAASAVSANYDFAWSARINNN